MVTASATAPESDEIITDFYPYGIRPYLEQFSYNVGDEIPINVVVDADCDISSFSVVYNGFVEEDTLAIVNDTVKGSMICDGKVEAPQFTITVVLENGKELQASIYGFVSDETVYINVNSLFGAKDIYWSEALASGARTEADYILNMTESVQVISYSNVQLEDSSALSPMATKNVSISGTLQWEDDWGNLHPLKDTKVAVVTYGNTIWTSAIPTLKGTVYTDTNGYYSVTFEYTDEFRPGLFIYPENENSIVKTGSGTTYIKSVSGSFWCSTSQILNYTIDMSTETGRAFQISQAVIAAAEFAETVSGENITSVTVEYPHVQNKINCYYDVDGSDGMSGPTIYILGIQETDKTKINGIILHAYSSWDVIMHEYFHHVQHEYNITANPGGSHNVNENVYEHYLSDHSAGAKPTCYEDGKITCANPPATLAKNYAIKLSYAEAVATVLGGIAQDYLINSGWIDTYIVTVGNDIYQSYNGAEISYGVGEERKGEANEATVAAILWDIYDDDTFEEHDNLALGYQAFWDVLVKNNGKTLTDFVNSYNSTYGILSTAPLDKLADILMEYNIASSPSYLIGNSLTRTPEFAWNYSYSLSENQRNNIYVFEICRPNRVTLVQKTRTGNFYALTEEEWNSVLATPEDYFYWSVSVYHDDGNGCVTGPYTSSYTKVMKPSGITLTVDDFPTKTITNQNDYFWFKYVAPTSGTYCFYSISSMDTFGELFEYPQYGLGTNGRYAYDDNSGEGSNFSFTRVLEYNEIVYIRVTGVGGSTGDFTMYTDFFEHLHIYNATIQANDQFTHRCACDCGLYEDVEHEWENLGGTTIRCIVCKYRYSEQIPGGEIQGGEDDTVELQSIDAILPSEPWSDEED